MNHTRVLPGVLLIALYALLMPVDSARASELNAPLPVDGNYKYGTLPNGMQYWIRAHKTPPGKIGMWMHVDTGSLNEEDNQQGLAHFLEHLAFNGTKNFPPGTLVKYFESIGIKFGQHQNAFTSFDQTTYLLSLPDTKDETVDKGLLCLADFAFRMLLLPEEIDKERGVILEESRSRKGAQQRLLDKMLPVLLPQSRVAERMPIGKEEVIKQMDLKLFQAYYKKWYRPEKTTLMIVGDIDPEKIVPLIEKNFKEWTAEDKSADLEAGVKSYDSVRAAVISDIEQTEGDVSIISLQPLKKMTTVADYRERLVNGIGTWILDRRFADLIQKGTAPFQSANADVSPFLNYAMQAASSGTGQPEKWDAILTTVLTEVKRARVHGFLAQELEDAKTATLSSAEQAAKTEATWDAHAFLGRMNRAVAEDRKPMAEAQRLELLKKLLPTITLDEVKASFVKHFAPEARLILLTMPEKKDLKLPTETEVLDVAKKAEGANVDALVAKARAKSLLETEPQPGAIARQQEDPDLKVVTTTLSNGAIVHYRYMDFKKEQFFCELTLSGGQIRETEGNRGVSNAAALAFSSLATDKLSSTDIRDYMTGKKAGMSGGATQDAFVLRIEGSPGDAEEAFRLTHLALTKPKLEESILKSWSQQMLLGLEQARTSVEAQVEEKVNALLSNNDPRFKRLTPERVKALSVQEAQQWLEKALTEGTIEMSIVGDIPKERALALAQKYIGSLPPRPQDNGLAKLRELNHAKGPLEAMVEVETITPRAVVLQGWRGADWAEVKDRRVLQVVRMILDARLREEIREKRALTYSVGCMATPSKYYRGMGMFATYFTADPDKAAEAAKISREVMENFAKGGPTDEEMATARKQFKNILETQLKEPTYWKELLADLNFHGTRLDDLKTIEAAYMGYTKEDLMEVVKKYFTDERKFQVIALPKKK